jgi:hypothetical protein
MIPLVMMGKIRYDAKTGCLEEDLKLSVQCLLVRVLCVGMMIMEFRNKALAPGLLKKKCFIQVFLHLFQMRQL